MADLDELLQLIDAFEHKLEVLSDYHHFYGDYC